MHPHSENVFDTLFVRASSYCRPSLLFQQVMQQQSFCPPILSAVFVPDAQAHRTSPAFNSCYYVSAKMQSTFLSFFCCCCFFLDLTPRHSLATYFDCNAQKGGKKNVWLPPHWLSFTVVYCAMRQPRCFVLARGKWTLLTFHSGNACNPIIHTLMCDEYLQPTVHFLLRLLSFDLN